MNLVLGQSFFSPESSEVGRHLWVIVSDPSRDVAIVIVNLSTSPAPASNPLARNDPPEVLQGEHPSAPRPSFIRCDQARVTSAEKVEEGLGARVLSSARPAPPSLVQKLQATLASSPHTKNEIKDILRSQGLVP